MSESSTTAAAGADTASAAPTTNAPPALDPSGSEEMPVPPPTPSALMHRALALAASCPPSETAFSVGSVLYDPVRGVILSTGFSRELPGNTHAEECCLRKFTERVGTGLPEGSGKLDIYSTLMPCSKRLSGLKTCMERIIEDGRIGRVFVGLGEDTRFVKEGNWAEGQLKEAGIEVVWVRGLEDDIKRVNEMWLKPK